MLVDNDIDPTKSIYFLGAKIIDQIKSSNFSVTDPNLLFKRINSQSTLGNKLSFDYYMLALDWLYIIGLIDMNETGDVVKCF